MLSRHGDRGVRQSLCLVAQHGLILSTVQHGTHIVAHTAVHTHIGADTGDVLHGTTVYAVTPAFPTMERPGSTRIRGTGRPTRSISLCRQRTFTSAYASMGAGSSSSVCG